MKLHGFTAVASSNFSEKLANAEGLNPPSPKFRGMVFCGGGQKKKGRVLGAFAIRTPRPSPLGLNNTTDVVRFRYFVGFQVRATW